MCTCIKPSLYPGWNVYGECLDSRKSNCMISHINTLFLTPRQKLANDTFKYIFLNENVWISITIWVKFVPKGPIDTDSALVQVMAWRQTGTKLLPEQTIIIIDMIFLVQTKNVDIHSDTWWYLNVLDLQWWQNHRRYHDNIMIHAGPVLENMSHWLVFLFSMWAVLQMWRTVKRPHLPFGKFPLSDSRRPFDNLETR